MAEKPRGKSRQRSNVARKFVNLGGWDKRLATSWKPQQILIVVAISLITTALIVDYEFQSIPDYAVGDIADRNVEAPDVFTVIDQEATEAKIAEALRSAEIVYSYDGRVSSRLSSDIHMAFADARDSIAEARESLALAPDQELPAEALQSLKSTVQEMLPQFGGGRTLDICLKYEFSQELENQLVGLLNQSMKEPGVVYSREVLVRYQDRAIRLQNEITREVSPLENRFLIRDLEQAKDLLKQQEYELTLVSGEEKKELIGFLERLVVPNTSFDEQATLDLERRIRSDVDPVLTQVKKGKTIVRSGDEITERSLQQLEALRALKEQEGWVDRVLGVFLVVGFFFFVLAAYFQVHLVKKQQSRSDFLLLSLVMIISLVFVRIFVILGELVSGSLREISLQDPVHFFFVAPVALGAILAILLVGINQSILFSVIHSVFVGLLTNQVALFVYCLTGSLIAIYALKQYRERSALIRAGAVIGCVNLLIVLALQLISKTAGFEFVPFVVRSVAAFVSGLSASMLTSLMLPTLESLFGLTTDIRLLELSNLNSPILRRLALEAPGTYHHSITVGTLAEAGAEAIDANTLLIRVGAYYHDIGKLKHPEYYVENQIYATNKHERLSPTMSSLILASHVKDGLAIAAEVNLGPKVADLIPQHHGTRVMTYFFRKAKEAADEKNMEISDSDFRYPGPKPQSKEAAILMIGDQVEAAARTLQEPSPGRIRSLIHRITQATIQDGQFDECDITMKELGKVARAFERVLTGMYHHRIEYPGFEFNKQRVEGKQAENQPVQ